MKISMLKKLGLSAFLLACPFLTQAAEPAAADAPPVRKVVLYKHGMGYFERRGKVTGNAKLALRFRVEQMKDLLTSFFAVDLSGGKISSVGYESKEPLSKQLQDIRIEVPEQAALSQFLAQLKGARITVKASGETLAGRVMGIEPVVQVIENQTIQKGFRLVLMTEAGAVRSVDLYSVSEYTLEDEALQRDLRRLLSISLDSKYTNRKLLTLQATGEGERELRIGYLIEMPIWKTSYRLILNKQDKDDGALLQGYALAENTSEDDWKDVDISFVAGNPLAYIMDLYTPYYVPRPQVPIPGLNDLTANWSAAPAPATLAPMATERAEKAKEQRGGGARRDMAAAMDKSRAPAAAAPALEEGGGVSYGAEQNMGDLLSQTMSSAAKGVKVGELFSYQGQETVSIPRGAAAMVSIVSQRVKGRRLLYYKAAFSPKPANAYVLKNETELTLEAGAVTVFEADTSLGEGILTHTLPPGSQEVLPYAIDATVDVTPEISSRQDPAFKGVLVNGVLTLTCVESLKSTWRIVNRGKAPATLWIDQPKNLAFKLSVPEKALDQVEGHYRFELELKAGEAKVFEVVEKRDVQQAVYLANLDATQIRFYASQNMLSDATRALLKQVLEIQNTRAGLQREINEWQQQIQRLSEEENRLRNNLNSLRADRPSEQDLRAKWVASLAAAEDSITALRAKLDEGSGRLRQLDESLGKAISEFKGE